MKLLVAILTCHRLDYYVNDLTIEWNKSRCLDQQARVNTQRSTWLSELKEFGVDYKFFYGTTLRDNVTKPNTRPDPNRIVPALREPLADEIYLDCGDNYTQNPQKLKGIFQYALENGYDYVLRVDDDTFVYPYRLLNDEYAVWSKVDYSGAGNGVFHPGGCLFVSRRAMELALAAPITDYADDVWLGSVMSNNKISVHEIASVHNLFGDNYNVVPEELPIEKLSAFHSCKPEAMEKLYVAGRS